MRWGLVPSWAKDVSVGNRMLNARVESLTEKPAFRTAAAHPALPGARRRLVRVGASGWTPRGKQPYFVTPEDGSGLAFAGLWEVWGRGEDRLYTCTVVTAPAVGALTEVHPRMPLVLPPGPLGRLARPGPRGRRRGRRAHPAGATSSDSRSARSGTAVGNVANNGAQLTARQESVSAPADQPALF